jgi:hypothetical protein
MRPTVFAELAAAELRSGTECCRGCDYVYYEVIDNCPRCGEPHPFLVEPQRDADPTASNGRSQSVADLGALTLRDLPEPNRPPVW